MAYSESNPVLIHRHTGASSTVTNPDTTSEAITYLAPDQQGDEVLSTAVLANGTKVVLSATLEQVSDPYSSVYMLAGYSSFQITTVDTSNNVNTQTLSFTGGNDLTGRASYIDDISMVPLANGGFVIAETTSDDNAAYQDGTKNNNLYYEVLSNTGAVTKSWTQVNVASDPSNDFFNLQPTASGGFAIEWGENDISQGYFERYNASGTPTSSAFRFSDVSQGTGTGQGGEAYLTGFAVDTSGDAIAAIPNSHQSVYYPSTIVLYNSSNTQILNETFQTAEGLGTGGTPLVPKITNSNYTNPYVSPVEDDDVEPEFIALPGGGFAAVIGDPTGPWNTQSGYPGFNMYLQKITVSGSTVTFDTPVLIETTTGNSADINLDPVALSNGNILLDVGGTYEVLKASDLPSANTGMASSVKATLTPVFGTLSPSGATLGNSPDNLGQLPLAADRNGGVIAALQTGLKTYYYGTLDSSLYVADFTPPAPTIASGGYTTNTTEGSIAVVGTAGAALTGDSSNGGTLSITGVSSTAGGTGTVGSALAGTYGSLTLNSNGSYTYQPSNTAAINGAATGSKPVDSFTFTVSNGNATAPETFAVTIDRPPTDVADIAAVLNGSTVSTASSSGVLSNDTDPDGDGLTVTAVSGSYSNVGQSTTGTYGTLTLAANGSYTYTASNSAALASAAVGVHTDSFTYTASDSHGGTTDSTLTVSIVGPKVTVSEAGTYTGLINAGSSGYQVSVVDTAANVSAGLAALNGIGSRISAITASDSAAVVVGVGKFQSYQGVLDKVAGGFSLFGQASAIQGDIDAIQADIGHVNAITAQNGTVTVSVATAGSDQAALDKIGSYAVSDTAANIGSGLAALNADVSHIASVTATDAPVVVGVGKFQSYQGVLDKVAGGFSFVGQASIIQGDLSAIQADVGHINTITAQNGTVTVSVATAGSDQAALDKIVGGYGVSDTEASVVNGLAALNADVGHIASIAATDTPVVVGVGKFQSYQGALDKVAGGFSFIGQASAIQGDIDGIEADVGHVNTITAQNGTVTVSVATLANDQAALNKIAGGFAIADTAANIASGLSTLEADQANITSVTASDTGAVTVGAGKFVPDQPVLDKIAGGFSINGLSSAISSNFGALAADVGHINSVAFADPTTPALTVTQAQAQSTDGANLLGKISGTYVLNVTNPDGSTTTTGHGDNLTIAAAPAPDTITGGGSNEAFVFKPAFGQDTITDFSQHLTDANETITLPQSEFANFAAVLQDATQSGSNTIITAANTPTDTLTLNNVIAATLHSSQFKFA